MVFEVVIGRSKKDVAKYGLEGTVFLGKQYVKMGQTTSLSNPVYMDVAGAHVVFIVGKRGSGKCVLPQTLISLSSGENTTIESLYNDLSRDAITLNTCNTETVLKPTRTHQVLSINGDLNLISKPILGLYRKYIKEEIIIISTSGTSEKSVYVTNEHPLLVSTTVSNGDQLLYLWKKAASLVVGDSILVHEGILKEEIVKSIEKVFYDGWVYDITIPETHNYLGNNIVCHNSYTMGAIAEGLTDLPKHIKDNLSILLIDTMGIYWTMKYPNYQDAAMLKEWGFESKPLDVKIYTPGGFFAKYKADGIPTDYPFTVRPIDVAPEDWCKVFAINPNSAEGVLLTRVVQILQDKGISYELQDLITLIKNDKDSDQNSRNIISNQLQKSQGWGVFGKEGTPLKDLVAGGQVTILDVSPYATMASGWDIKALVVGLICRILFNQRMLARKSEEFSKVDAAMHYFSKEEKQELDDPLVWVALDEAHELLPNEGKTAATDSLITILREGRQPGISLILATQQPAKIHTDVMTQSDIVLAHRLTAQMDIKSLGALMQSYMSSGLDRELDNLPHIKGSAIIFDDSNERLFPIQMRPRFTWHGGSSPTAIREKKDNFDKALRDLKDL